MNNVLGPDNLFIDDDIPKGEDFEKYLNAQLNGCFVFLAIIGPNWLQFHDKEGRRRLDMDDDWVRVEIATALARGIKVIPVIIDDAVMPDASYLPSNLKLLAKRQAITLRNHQFDQDLAVLVDTLGELLGADQRVIKAKKRREQLYRDLFTGRRPRLGHFLAGFAVFIAIGGYIYYKEAPVGGSSSNPPKEVTTEVVRPPWAAALREEGAKVVEGAGKLAIGVAKVRRGRPGIRPFRPYW